jgi:hypothetical protein
VSRGWTRPHAWVSRLHTALDLVVTQAEANGSVQLLGEIAHILGSPDRLDAALGNQAGHMGAAAQDLAHTLLRQRRLVHGDLSDMFDAPSTVDFDPTAPMLSIGLSRLGGVGDDTALALAMTCASTWMEAAMADPSGGKCWVIYDEAWRVMRRIGRAAPPGAASLPRGRETQRALLATRARMGTWHRHSVRRS